jgi:5S rRNA maturation endonuclease (ribonuclease M5)
MISTKGAMQFKDVPTTWIFEHYLNLTEQLDGQQIKIKSVFKTEKTPSMIVYMDAFTMTYKFKDFSSSIQGDAITLVQSIFSIEDRASASFKILNDYKTYLGDNKSYKQPEIKIYENYKVSDYTIRHWSNFDQKYWGQYHIGSNMLEAYNVSPLEYYKMTRTELDGTVSEITINGLYLYGYFKSDGTMYKIYQPKNVNKKFLKLGNYTQGSQQLTLTKDYLVITSSLKDVMAFNKLAFNNVECIAPDSENTMIKESSIDKLKEKYKSICVLFDNDEAGINSMKKYKERYGLNYIILDMEKDVSDSIKVHGLQAVKEKLFPLLKKAIHERQD